ncbi:hypothetical protein [Paenibacillus pini]|uniref:Uncharacterized protein n=1 Tax=Paenibacillus pini JCM 16418 TaxID=1236976 RepID=W7YNW3_9BACL|nr:hypothetical protein [Paenibacillus pini]GAF06376.1 hypothetical protein JCM16418_329 [Paenibacillus pini JCM 16418]
MDKQTVGTDELKYQVTHARMRMLTTLFKNNAKLTYPILQHEMIPIGIRQDTGQPVKVPYLFVRLLDSNPSNTLRTVLNRGGYDMAIREESGMVTQFLCFYTGPPSCYRLYWYDERGEMSSKTFIRKTPWNQLFPELKETGEIECLLIVATHMKLLDTQKGSRIELGSYAAKQMTHLWTERTATAGYTLKTVGHFHEKKVLELIGADVNEQLILSCLVRLVEH